MVHEKISTSKIHLLRLFTIIRGKKHLALTRRKSLYFHLANGTFTFGVRVFV